MPFFAVLSLLLVAQAPPSGAEILRRCRAAYDAVNTLEEDVTGLLTAGGTDPARGGSAHILFERPGKLRVSGSTMFHSTYELVADGPTVWVLSGGSWRKAKDVERGIAKITGISANAGMAVPATLFHEELGDFTRPQGVAKVSMTSVAGRRVYRLEEKAAAYDVSIWIDAKTYFLVKTVTKVMNRDIVIDFAPPKVNRPIPANAFKRSSAAAPT